MSKTKVGIINVTGYAGSELVRILLRHPMAEIVSVTGRSGTGQNLGQFFPHLGELALKITDEITEAVDVVFSALPHKASAEAIMPILHNTKAKVIDISADFRLKDANLYNKWYDFTHPAPQLLKEAVYGITELKRKEVAGCRLLANPGCYPTSVILALAPVVKEGIITDNIIIDSKSGVSGAGRMLAFNVHYSEANENISAYSLNGHRHLPEMVQELAMLREGFNPLITFVPHLIPMTRGILSTCYASLKKDSFGGKNIKQAIMELYKSFFKGEPFVKIVNSPPQTKQTAGSNLCLIYPVIDERTDRLIVISCIDNLVKGAAGEAVQNMNLMMGFPEEMGLDMMPLYP